MQKRCPQYWSMAHVSHAPQTYLRGLRRLCILVMPRHGPFVSGASALAGNNLVTVQISGIRVDWAHER